MHAGAAVRVITTNGRTPMFVAAEKGLGEMIRIMVEDCHVSDQTSHHFTLRSVLCLFATLLHYPSHFFFSLDCLLTCLRTYLLTFLLDIFPIPSFSSTSLFLAFSPLFPSLHRFSLLRLMSTNLWYSHLALD